MVKEGQFLNRELIIQLDGACGFLLLYEKYARLSFLFFVALQIYILNGKGSLERNWVDATGSTRIIVR